MLVQSIGHLPETKQHADLRRMVQDRGRARLRHDPFAARNLSSADPDNLRGPRTVASGAEAAALSLHVRWPAVAEFDRALRECNILEVPTPTDVDVRAKDNSPCRDARWASTLGSTSRRNLLNAVQRNAKTLVAYGQRATALGDGAVGEPSHPAHSIAKPTTTKVVALLTHHLRCTSIEWSTVAFTVTDTPQPRT